MTGGLLILNVLRFFATSVDLPLQLPLFACSQDANEVTWPVDILGNCMIRDHAAYESKAKNIPVKRYPYMRRTITSLEAMEIQFFQQAASISTHI